ncbi:Laccase-1 [Dactylellina cionopaga]|nr:Laccase-1 [Dactylellina cionopaga]
MVLKVDGVKVVDLLIDNFDDGNHPMHLHGHKFWVMASGDGYFNMSNYKNLPKEGRPYRDTVTIEGFGFILIRFITDNPGMWAFHCHNVWHAEAGLVMSFFTRPDIVRDWTLPSDLVGFCSHPNATNGFFDGVKEVVPLEWRHDNGED